MKNTPTKILILCIASVFLQGSIAFERLGIPAKRLHPEISQAYGSQSNIDHTVWDYFLAKYTFMDEEGVVRVAYKHVSAADRVMLKNYLEALSKIKHKNYTRDAQLAYWVNLYNALTVEVILDHYPVSSIREITDGLFDFGPWDDDRITLDKLVLSLHDIENSIIRPLWDDTPETHYLLNCAAVGCPNLGQSAYTAFNIQKSLIEAAIAYINSPRGVFVREDSSLVISKIYRWYFEDFGGTIPTLRAHLQKYARPDLHALLEMSKNFQDHFYDWSLNDHAQPNTLRIPPENP